MLVTEFIKRRIELRKFKQQLADELVFDGYDDLAETDSLMAEQLSRNILFLGEEGVQKCQSSFVVVVGLGGVGSHAAHMLARAGVGHLRLIDFDQVTLSSLNRHAVATRGDVGTFKVVAMKKHLLEIVPSLKIDVCAEMFTKESASRLIGGNPGFVLDCIDNLATKVDLIEYCAQNNIRVMSSMGAGAKRDASRIHIADISETSEDPLARSTRRALRLRGIHSSIPVVFSSERPTDVKLAPLMDSQVDDANEYAPLPNFRSRILPVLGTIPALFGNAMASHVILELANFPTSPLPIKLRRKAFEKYLKDFFDSEGLNSLLLKITADDVGFILQEIYNGRSAFSKVAGERLVLLRWNPLLPAELGNMLFLTKEEAEVHKNSSQDKLATVYGDQYNDLLASLKRQRDWAKWKNS